MSIFSERMLKLMSLRQLTQKELAQRINVTESAISYYIKGKRIPRGDILIQIAKTLNTTTDYLLGTSNNISTADSKSELQYLQQNLEKLDQEQLKKAKKILKLVFDDIFLSDE